mmetsp:Transcript_50644/g.147317  ORF Transcript_50644/g.147317 Transcript_50644/m.147317 type:complete len:630 (+) Transcript_50644:61-1950(+)
MKPANGDAAEQPEVVRDEDAERTPSAYTVLRRNPDLVKAMAASGLQRSALMVAAVLGVQNLRALVWGEHTAEYTARLSMGMSVVAMVSAGMFGRMGDRLGRRTAAAVFGFTSFLPSWTLLVFGFNEVGLYASCAAFLVSGVGLCSDALLVLANDVTREEDRGMAFGLYQAATNGAAFLLFGLPSCFTVLLEVLPNPSISQWLWYNFMLTAIYFVIIFSIRIREEANAPSAANTPAARTDANDDVELPHDLEAPPTSSPATEAAGRCARLWRWVQKFPLIRELRMMSSDPNLRRLYATGALLFFSGDIVFDLGSQYFRDNLDLIPREGLSEEQRMEMLHANQLVSVLTTLPPEIGIIPGAMLVAFLAKRLGSQRLLRLMIPIAALMTAAGSIMAAVPEYWLVPLVCLFLNYASLAANVPLKHLLAAAAPEGRTGEAMASLGMLNQAVCFIANTAVMISTPLLYSAMEKPLWIAYLCSGFITFLGSFTILGLKVSEKSNESNAVAPTGGKDADSRCIPRDPDFFLEEDNGLGDAAATGRSPRSSGTCGTTRTVEAKRAVIAKHSLRSAGSAATTAATADDDAVWQPPRRESRTGTMDSCAELMADSPRENPVVAAPADGERRPQQAAVCAI